MQNRDVGDGLYDRKFSRIKMSINENGRNKLASRYTQVIYVSRPIEFKGHGAMLFPQYSTTYSRFLWTIDKKLLAFRRMM